MKIGLIISPFASQQTSFIKPAGLLYIASYLATNEIKSTIFDFSRLAKTDYDNQIHSQKLHSFDILGFSVYQENFTSTIEFIRIIKKIGFSGKIVLGGPFPSMESRYILNKYKNVDFIVIGEGELAFFSLVEYFRGNKQLCEIPNLVFRNPSGKILKNQLQLIPDIDSLPFPDYEITYSPEYLKYHFYDEIELKEKLVLPVTSSRGCPFKCNFCVISPLMIKWRARSPENVLSEVDYFLKKTPYTHVFFFDANFFVNPQRAMQIAVGLKKRGLTFAFSSTVKLLLKHMEYIPELSKAGLRMVEVGVENANNDLIKEELGKDHCTDEANEAIRLLKEFNIIPLIDFIMFTPLTKLKHIERNLIFLKNNDYLCKDRYNAFFNFLIIYSGTKIKANIEKNSGKSLSVEKLYSANDLYEDKEIKLLFNFFVGFFEKNFLHKILLQQKKILAICTLFDRQEVKIYDLTKKIQRLKYNSLLLQYLPAKILSKSIELLKTGDVLNVRLLRNCVFKNIEGKMSLKEFLALNDSIINDCESRLAP